MHPYKDLPDRQFYKLAVANRSMFDISDIWTPKFRISTKDNAATFGSCFAQHLGKALKKNGVTWIDGEKAPQRISPESRKKFNYGIFSARTGNIYTTSLLKQWLKWALEGESPPDEKWEQSGRFFDPFRPNIEPNGFASHDEMLQLREITIRALKKVVSQASVFVFTLGLTESWFNKEHGYEYPMCPGTIAGTFDSTKHLFVNQNYPFILDCLEDSIKLLRNYNSNIKILLTVSPVPLTATATNSHVVPATSYSKSVLRAVAGDIANNYDYVDYFPSYEIINSPVFKGAFFEPNQRSVNPYGVNFVMENFFSCLSNQFDDLGFSESPIKEQLITGESQNPLSKKRKTVDDTICEEELLDAFGGLK